MVPGLTSGMDCFRGLNPYFLTVVIKWACYAFCVFFANNFKAGQPISFCLQNLQAIEPRTKPVTGKAIMIKVRSKTSLSQVKL